MYVCMHARSRSHTQIHRPTHICAHTWMSEWTRARETESEWGMEVGRREGTCMRVFVCVCLYVRVYVCLSVKRWESHWWRHLKVYILITNTNLTNTSNRPRRKQAVRGSVERALCVLDRREINNDEYVEAFSWRCYESTDIFPTTANGVGLIARKDRLLSWLLYTHICGWKLWRLFSNTRVRCLEWGIDCGVSIRDRGWGQKRHVSNQYATDMIGIHTLLYLLRVTWCLWACS